MVILLGFWNGLKNIGLGMYGVVLVCVLEKRLKELENMYECSFILCKGVNEMRIFFFCDVSVCVLNF